MSEIVCLICARGGSKGVPKKNIRSFFGKPLIAHTIELAQSLDKISEVIVSTDDEEIAKVSKQYGATVPFKRPSHLALDTSPEWLVWQHAIEWLNRQERIISALVVLPATAPLRAVEDVEGALKVFEEAKCDGVLCGTDAYRNPSFNMITVDASNRCSLALPNGSRISRRQDGKRFYDVTTVCYVLSPVYVRSKQHLFDGDIRMYKVPVERSIDIDTKFDFDVAELIKKHLQK